MRETRKSSPVDRSDYDNPPELLDIKHAEQEVFRTILHYAVYGLVEGPYVPSKDSSYALNTIVRLLCKDDEVYKELRLAFGDRWPDVSIHLTNADGTIDRETFPVPKYR